MRGQVQLRTFYLHYHNTNGYKTYISVVTYHQQLPRKNLHDSSIRWTREKLNTLYFQLQKTHRHQARQGVLLPLEVLILKAK